MKQNRIKNGREKTYKQSPQMSFKAKNGKKTEKELFFVSIQYCYRNCNMKRFVLYCHWLFIVLWRLILLAEIPLVVNVYLKKKQAAK